MTTPEAGVTHHIVLSDGSNLLGLMSADNMKSFVRVPVARTSLKTASGDTLYSDLEPPYHTLAQTEFSGGRGQRYFREDITKYSDGTGIDTRFKGQVTLGPKLETYTAANVGIPEHLPGNITSLDIQHGYTGSSASSSSASMARLGGVTYPQKLAQSFIARSNYIVGAEVYGKCGDTGSISLTVSLYTDSGGSPGSSLASASIAVSNTSFQWLSVTFDSPVLVTDGATYWIVVIPTLDENESFTWGFAYGNPFPSGEAKALPVGSNQWSYTYFAGLDYNLTNGDFAFRVNYKDLRRAQSFNYSGTGTYNVSHLYLLLRRAGNLGTNNIKVELQTSVAGEPSGTKVAGTDTVSLSSSDIPTTWSWVRVDLGTTVQLNKGTTYHIVVYIENPYEMYSFLYWGADNTGGYTGGTAFYRMMGDVLGWEETAGYDHYFKVNSGQGLDDETLKFFQYQGCLYAVAGPTEGDSASTIWMNGYKGRAADNSADKTKLISANVNGASPGWTTNEWAGCIAYIWSGPGKGEYRTIISNTANTLTVDDAWTATHTNETHYVILGSSTWRNVTPQSGVTLQHPVTDVLVCNSIVYFCQGDKGYVVRYREYWDAGTTSWRRSDGTTNTVDYDGTNYADYMLQLKQNVWRAHNVNQISYAPVVTWPSNLSYNTAISIATSQYNITGLHIYDGDLVVGKEDSLWLVKNNQPEQVPIDFTQMADKQNCRAMASWDLFLFFSLGYGLERLYGQHIDDMGPNRDEGLPPERVGPITCLLGAPGSLFAGIDAGADGYSSVMVWNGSGWHEITRCPTLGDSVRDLFIQVLPGKINRLWIAMGNDCAWIPLPEQGVNPLKESSYVFTGSGELTTSWIDISLVDVPKYFHELKLITEKLSAGHRTIDAYYRVDDDEDWTYIGRYDTSPIQSLPLVESGSVIGRRIQLRFVMTSDDSSVSPNLIAYTLESLGRLPPKSRFDPLVIIDDHVTMLNGQADDKTRVEILEQLDTWAGSATPLVMTTCDPAFTNMLVWIDPPTEVEKVLEKQADGSLRIVGGRARLTIIEA